MILKSLWNPAIWNPPKVNLDNLRPKSDASQCKECGGYFTPSGLRMHQGSEKCRLATVARPLREKVEVEAEKLTKAHKRSIYKNVALALKRRNLGQICGLESAPTKLLHTDMTCKVLEEYWVHDWVVHIWNYHNKSGYTRNAYSFFEKINQMSENDRQSEIGLVMLNIYG